MQALWDRVHQQPDDDEARRVLADALLERGDPRGQLIAVQLELAKLPEDERGPAEHALEAEERALLDAHADVWVHDWPFELRPHFVRGFPERQHTTAADFVDHWRRARELAPTLREVVLTDEEPRGFSDHFHAMAAMARGLTRLTLPITFHASDAQVLPELPTLSALTFSGGTLSYGTRHLLAHPLEHLAFEFDVGVSDGAALAALPLKSFVSRGSSVSPQAWPALERLTIDRVKTVVRPQAWPNLRRLELLGAQLGRRGVRELLYAGHPKVRRLGLRDERLEATDLMLLERWPALEVLDLRGCRVSRDALERNPVVRRLRRLIFAG